MATTSLPSSEKLKLVPVNLSDAVEYEEFKRQRIICGWKQSDEDLQGFREKQQQRIKSLFWIMIPPKQQSDVQDNDEAKNDTCRDDLFSIRAGHISLDSYTDPPDAEIAREDRSIMTIQTFFTLPEYRAGGLGRAAMDHIEALAKQEPYGSPQCHTITLTTMNKRYVIEDGPEGRGVWERLGMDVPLFSIQDWYQKLGYVWWKEEPRYYAETLDGVCLHLTGSFMRKKLGE
jgi:GNAT superfamily N-acetyltransferase